ncbi:protein FLX-like 4 [Senna tora]|uniref:Protein FLX-like 4 n=1 Tax=Senna tora TaxID=362788 RepID=A0A834W5H9_9FABA|nr:protein FLX-like 4 [Senna tora]
MAARGNIPPAYDERSAQVPGMMRHGPFPGLSSAPGHRLLEPRPPGLLGNTIASQEADIERLVGDNRRLASTHVALRDELVNAQQELQKLRAHIGSIQTESDIQIRISLDKIAKMEVDIRAGEGVKKELQRAHMEAQSLAAARQELKGQVERAAQELKKVRGDVKIMPDLQAELDTLVQEHQMLRATFEYEKNKNVELVEQMKGTEKNLIGMAREVEMLRAEIQNVEKRVQAPKIHGAATTTIPGTFVDAYGRPHGPMAVDQVGNNNAAWTGPYDPSVARR